MEWFVIWLGIGLMVGIAICWDAKQRGAKNWQLPFLGIGAFLFGIPMLVIWLVGRPPISK
jgi:hypothetical protein